MYVRKCVVRKINGSDINKLAAAMDTITLVNKLSTISTKYCLVADFHKSLQNTVYWLTFAVGRRVYELTSLSSLCTGVILKPG